jgi:hypothetical protein
MSHLGQKRTKAGVDGMSALPPQPTFAGVVGTSVQCQVQTSGPWLDNMISTCATSRNHASVPSQ